MSVAETSPPRLSRIASPDHGMDLNWYGRIQSPPKRKERTTYRAVKLRSERPYRYYPVPEIKLDQGPTPRCVGYSGRLMLTSGPTYNSHRNPLTPTGDTLYNIAQRYDEFPGIGYAGSTVRGLCDGLLAMGLIERFEWAWDADTYIDHCLEGRPGILGTDWYSGMDDTDKDGFIWPTGTYLGGHAYFTPGANRSRRNPDGSKGGAVRMAQTWGEWGQNGRAWITAEAVQFLIESAGEAAIIYERDVY